MSDSHFKVLTALCEKTHGYWLLHYQICSGRENKCRKALKKNMQHFFPRNPNTVSKQVSSVPRVMKVSTMKEA